MGIIRATLPQSDDLARELEIVVWAKTKCNSYITVEGDSTFLIDNKPGPCYHYYFADEADRNWFIMRWA